jgi:hypothetical protein
MNILKKYFVFLFIFLGGVNIAHANLEITEVMYDPQGANTSHQWVEVYNNSSSSIDLSSWYLVDYDTSWHFRTISSDDSTILNSNSYAIIAKTSNLADFKSKNPNLGGQILKANVTLGAESGHIGLSSDKKNITNEISYLSVMDNGNSLQKINGSWKESSPTAGASNILSTSSSTENISTNSSSVSSSSSETSTSKVSITDSGEYKITTKIISPKIITAKIPFYISSLTTTSKKETLATGKYLWNFGDGTSIELRNNQEFNHTYEYPGEYVLSLSFFNNSFEKIPSATSRVILKVVFADIIISSVGDNSDPFIEFENKSSYEIDISGFILKANNHNFTIPTGTIILPNHKIKLSSKISGFSISDLSSIVLTNQSGDIVATYPIKNVPVPSNKITSTLREDYSLPRIENNKDLSNKKNIDNSDSSFINLNDLAAQAGNIENQESNSSNKSYVWFALVGIIAIGASVIFITRKKTEIPDYVENNIRAEDIKIIE